METEVGLTCSAAKEALTQRYIITGVAGRHLTGLFLPALEVASLSSKLGWLLQFSIAVLGVVGGR